MRHPTSSESWSIMKKHPSISIVLAPFVQNLGQAHHNLQLSGFASLGPSCMRQALTHKRKRKKVSCLNEN